MNRLKQLLLLIQLSYHDKQQGKVILPLVISEIALAGCLVALVAYIIKFYWAYLLFIGIVIWGIREKYMEKKGEAQQMEQNVYAQKLFYIQNLLFQVLCELSNVLPIQRPLGLEDISTQTVTLGGINVFQSLIEKDSKLTSLSSDSAIVMKKRLQTRINSLLRAGKVMGVNNCYSWDGRHPLIVVADVLDRGLHWELLSVVVDNEQAARFCDNYQTKTHESPANNRDEDF